MNAHQVNTTTSLKMWLGTRRRLRGAASVVALLPFLDVALTGGVSRLACDCECRRRGGTLGVRCLLKASVTAP